MIQDRGYVTGRGQALVPSWLAFAVTRLLEENFDWLVDYDFTAEMEEDLDAIAAGDKDRVAWLSRFYFGDGSGNEEGEGLRDLVANLGEIDAREVNSIPIGEGIVLRVGRYGPYLEDSAAEPGEDGNPRRASVPEELAPDELTVEKARELLETQPEGDQVLGTDPVAGTPIVARNGRYGPYVTEILPDPEIDTSLSQAAQKRALAAAPKPRTASLFKTMSLQSVTLDDALLLLSLPRVVGTDPETGTEITAQNGRYGPYLKKGTDSRTLASEEALFTTTLDEALAIYAQPKRGRGRDLGTAAARAGRRPDLREADRGQGGPVRRLRHRRRHQPDPAARPDARVDHPRAGDRAARREARVRARQEEGPGAQGDDDAGEGPGEEGRDQEVGPTVVGLLLACAAAPFVAMRVLRQWWLRRLPNTPSQR